MRLLVAAERLGPAGGMERFLEIVLPALAATGVEMRVLARDVERLPDGLAVERIAWSDEHDAPSSAAQSATQRALADFAPDVTVAHNVMDAGVVAALRSAPRFVYHVHDHRPFCPNGDRVYPRSGVNCTAPLGAACALHALLDGCAYGPRPRTLRLIARRQRLRDGIAAADAVVVASAYVAARAVASGVPAARVATIPLPLPDDAYAAAGTPPPSGGVLFAGRIVPQKGLDVLVRALARIPAEERPWLRVCGDGSALASVRTLAAARGVAFEAAGNVAPARVRAALDRASFVALPSRWAEPFGYAGIEAFARGRTVVASAAGGTGAWLADGVNGIAVPGGDEDALANAILRLTRDVALRERLSARARADAERFRSASIVAELLGVYGSTRRA